jgi:hypothetical protein
MRREQNQHHTGLNNINSALLTAIARPGRYGHKRLRVVLGHLDSVVFTQHPPHRDTLIVNGGNGHCPAGVAV